jgi:hypothetical protein
VFLNGALLILALVLRAAAGKSLGAMYAITAVSALIGGSYIPMLMTAIYSLAAKAPCTLRFIFVTEGAWDVACASVASAILGVVAQTVLLYRYYSNQKEKI